MQVGMSLPAIRRPKQLLDQVRDGPAGCRPIPCLLEGEGLFSTRWAPADAGVKPITVPSPPLSSFSHRSKIVPLVRADHLCEAPTTCTVSRCRW